MTAECDAVSLTPPAHHSSDGNVRGGLVVFDFSDRVGASDVEAFKSFFIIMLHRCRLRLTDAGVKV